MGWLWSKLKGWLLAAAVAIGPVLYVLGRQKGSSEARMDEVEKQAKRQEARATFNKRMEEYYATDRGPRNRSELVDRLRNDGL